MSSTHSLSVLVHTLSPGDILSAVDTHCFKGQTAFDPSAGGKHSWNEEGEEEGTCPWKPRAGSRAWRSWEGVPEGWQVQAPCESYQQANSGSSAFPGGTLAH